MKVNYRCFVISIKFWQVGVRETVNEIGQQTDIEKWAVYDLGGSEGSKDYTVFTIIIELMPASEALRRGIKL